jgi:hypothetical protein
MSEDIVRRFFRKHAGAALSMYPDQQEIDAPVEKRKEIIDWGIEQPADYWMPVILPETPAKTGEYPERFIDGSQVGHAVACLRAPQVGWPVPVFLAEVGGIAMRQKGRALHRDFFGLERVISFITDPFPWPEVEAFTGAIVNLPELPLRVLAYARSAVIYEELYDGNRGTAEELGYLSRSMVAYFRSFQYEKCAALARGLPVGRGTLVRGVENLPPGTTLADLQQLGKVCELVHAAGRSDPSHRLTVQASLTWQGCLRLKYLLGDGSRWGKLTKDDLRLWLDGLTGRLRVDLAACSRVRDDAVRSFLETQTNRWEKELRSMSTALN